MVLTMIKKIILISALITCLFIVPICADETYGPGIVPEDSICKKIEQLYENEENESLKKMLTETLKATIHPGRYKSYATEEYICSVPYSEQLKYNLPIIGFDNTWPRYWIENNELLVYGKKHDLLEAEEHKKSINTLYDFINDVKFATAGMTDEDKIYYLQTLLSQTLEYDTSIDTGIIYKVNDVLNEKKGVCTGYSNLFYLCCINIGIKCECVGNKEHMFNRVWLNNEWKYIDCTWNDSMEQNVWYLLNENELDEYHKLLECFKKTETYFAQK